MFAVAVLVGSLAELSGCMIESIDRLLGRSGRVVMITGGNVRFNTGTGCEQECRLV